MSSSIRLLHLQAKECIDSGHLDRAITIWHKILHIETGDTEAHLKLAENALLQRVYPTGEYHLAAALASDPSLVQAANNLSILYLTSGRPHMAVTLLQETLSRAPEFPEAWFNLGNGFLQLRSYERAIEAFNRALALRPDYANAWINLGRAYRMTLQHDRAFECVETAARLAKTPQAASNWVFMSMYDPTVTAVQAAAIASDWATRFAGPVPVLPVASRSRTADPILKIGYICPTFRRHAIGWLIEPILARHDRQQFRVFCYSDNAVSDEMTARIRNLDLTFQVTVNLSDEQLANKIREDQIDLLVDLNAQTLGSRLLVFARRPAPVQINYLAYPFTCGLSAMDYRITDQVLDPEGGTRYGPESLIRLQHCFWIYRPDPESPASAVELPSSTAGEFTFASLNDCKKLNSQVIETCATILRRVPDSRLLLLADDVAAQEKYFRNTFQRAGIEPARIALVGKTARSEFLKHLQSVDLSLDPFPYGGHTTTLDSLWMGVPVLTVAGDAPYARGAASIHQQLGLHGLIAGSIHEYIQVAVQLANEQSRLAAFRKDLRQRMMSSRLCDEQGFVEEYERGLKRAWQRHLQGEPPADIDLNENVPASCAPYYTVKTRQ